MKMTLEKFGETVKHAPDLIAGFYSALFGVNDKIDSLYFKEGKTEEEKIELETQEKLQKHLIKKINKTFKVMEVLPMFTAMLGLDLTVVFYCKFVDPEKFKNHKAIKDLDEEVLKEEVQEVSEAWECFRQSYFKGNY